MNKNLKYQAPPEYKKRSSMLIRAIDRIDENDNLDDEIERILQQGIKP